MWLALLADVVYAARGADGGCVVFSLAIVVAIALILMSVLWLIPDRENQGDLSRIALASRPPAKRAPT